MAKKKKNSFGCSGFLIASGLIIVLSALLCHWLSNFLNSFLKQTFFSPSIIFISIVFIILLIFVAKYCFALTKPAPRPKNNINIPISNSNDILEKVMKSDSYSHNIPSNRVIHDIAKYQTKLILEQKSKEKTLRPSNINNYDSLEGHDFEYFCAGLLEKNGFDHVEVTRGSGDQGIDILAQKDGIKYGIQCKRYSSSLDNSPVQEVKAGISFYNCHVGAVMTNQYFTDSAKKLAKANMILLWDRDKLNEFIKNSGITDIE